MVPTPRVPSVALALFFGSQLLFACRTQDDVTRPKKGNSASAPLSDGFDELRLHADAGELGPSLAKEANKARAKKLRPFVEVGAVWCKPCQELEKNLAKPEFRKALSGISIIHLDVDEWGAVRLKRAGIDAPYIPVFIELDGDGRPTTRRMEGGDWNADSTEGMAAALRKFFSGA